MEMVMSNGFAELSADEMNEIDGGRKWWAVVGGVVVGGLVVAGCVAAAPVIAAGAATGGIGCVLASGSAISGGLIGYGLSRHS